MNLSLILASKPTEKSYVPRKNRPRPRKTFPLQEYPLRTHLKIRTEADYLRAHLTVLERRSRVRNSVPLRNATYQLTSTVKKWLAASNDFLRHPQRW